MPQRRKTRAELALSGALKKNPQRYGDRYDAPIVAGVGYAPRHLTATQKSLWRELVNAAPEGLLTSADEFAIELAVKMLDRCRTQPVKASEIGVLLNLLGRLGLTPADRSRLNISTAPESPGDNPFAEFDTHFRVDDGGQR